MEELEQLAQGRTCSGWLVGWRHGRAGQGGSALAAWSAGAMGQLDQLSHGESTQAGWRAGAT
jgi:hypothetical protein